MARNHLRFKNFHPSIIEAANDLFDARPWSKDTEGARQDLQNFVTAACSVYRVPAAELRVQPILGFAQYLPMLVERDSLGTETVVRDPLIVTKRPSIFSMLYGVRFHVLVSSDREPVGGDIEQDALSWAASLFYRIRPVMFRARVREGRIVGMSAADTYKSETWNRMVLAGVATADGDLLVRNFDPATLETLEASLTDEQIHAFMESEEVDDIEDTEGWDEDPEDFGDEGDTSEGIDDEEPVSEDLTIAEQVAAETDASFANDGLDALGIVALRRLGTGRSIPNMWNMSTPELRAALRAAGVRAS